MCGIFSVIKQSSEDKARLDQGIQRLFQLSKKRGQEASGMGWIDGDELHVVKKPDSPDQLAKLPEVKEFFKSDLERYFVFGHARLVTNGHESNQENNQPIIRDRVTVAHNGIILNDKELWEQFPDIKRHFETDTEVFAALTEKFVSEGLDLLQAVSKVFNLVVGAANVLVIHQDLNQLAFGTNHGSLHWSFNPQDKFFMVGSEKYTLEQMRGHEYAQWIDQVDSGHKGTVGVLDLDSFELKLADYREDPKLPAVSSRPLYKKLNYSIRKELKRCTRCILPESFPMIEFDEHGVCQFCRAGGEFKYQGEQALRDLVAPYRSKDGSPDCVVAVSGGRDSSYGLHYIKTELGMNPVAYTYDWGMVTDIARRNISRMCEALDVEHILRSADIRTKRRNIKKNIEAWLRQPDLGMIPLFMAGDKQFYYYAQQVSRERNLPLILFCAGNPYEITEFKTGFCGITSHKGAVLTGMSLKQKMQMAWYYAKQFGKNWHYWNSSVFDTLFAYYSTYILKDRCAYLYHYIPFDEKKVNDVLLNQYQWETAHDIDSTWRIGDGTACFYNFIYHTVAGFSEHDTFRSHQIRNGDITREQAMATIDKDNLPRFEALEEYANLVGFNLTEAIHVIMNAPKKY